MCERKNEQNSESETGSELQVGPTRGIIDFDFPGIVWSGSSPETPPSSGLHARSSRTTTLQKCTAVPRRARIQGA